MPSGYGGLASRQPVKGAFGIGKIQLKFRPKNNRYYSIKTYLALFVYGIFISAILFSYAWSQERLRYKYVYPFLQKSISLMDKMKYNIECYIYSKVPLSSELHSNIIIDDTNGIPSISSSNLSYALYLQGYQHAKDRLISMDILRRKSLGMLSQLYGNTASSIESDKLMRTLNIANIAKLDVKLLDNNDLILLESYCNGINEYLQEKRYYTIEYNILYTNLMYPWQWFYTSKSQIESWEPYHTLAILRMLAYEWSHDWEDELNRWLILKTFDDISSDEILWLDNNKKKKNTFASTEKEEMGIDMNLIPSLSSIAIAISSNKTQNNHAYLVNNLNSKSLVSGSWYFNSIYTDDIQVSGASIPGIPYIFIGRNQNISWGMTLSTLYDMEDLFIISDEKVLNSVSKRTEYIPMKDTEEFSILHVTDTIYGPVISSLFMNIIQSHLKTTPTSVNPLHHSTIHTHNLIALSSQALKQPMNLKFLHQLNHATDFNDFQNGVNGLQSMHLNILYSDIQGNIGSVTTGRQPSRISHGDLPTNGNIPGNAWVENNSNAMMNPSIYNPMEGVIIAAEDRHHTKIIDAIHLGVDQSLNQNHHIGLKDLQDLLLDTYSNTSIAIKELILNISIPNDLEVNIPQEHIDIIYNSKKLLTDFDGYYHTNASAPVLIEAFRIVFLSNILSPFGGMASNIYRNNPFSDYNHRINKYPISLSINWIKSFILNEISVNYNKTNTMANNSSAISTSSKWIQNFKKYRPHLSLSTSASSRIDSDRILIYSLIEAYQWCSTHFSNSSSNLTESNWSWGEAHHIFKKSIHPNLSPVFAAGLSVGPLYDDMSGSNTGTGSLIGSSGGLDTILTSSYNEIDLKLDYEGKTLISSSDSSSTSIRLAFDMGDNHCYYGNTPVPSSSLTPTRDRSEELTQKLKSYWNPEISKSYLKICFIIPKKNPAKSSSMNSEL